MQARKYIRFDSTQELRMRLMSVKPADYRIIARTRAPDRSMTRRLWQHAWLRHNINAWSASPLPGRRGHMHADSRFAHIFRVSPRIETSQARATSRMGETFLSVPDTARSGASNNFKRIKSKRRECCSQSNFSSPPLSHFCRLAVANARLRARIALRLT